MSKSVTRKKKTKSSGDIVIDVKQRKNLQSQLQLLKRKLKNATASDFPSCLSPMLATLTTDAFNSEDWIYEIKWDGYRAIACNNNGTIDLRSRNNENYLKDYPPIVKAIKNWNINIVVDGEIVVIDEEGKPDFNALQNWKRIKDENSIFFFVFDILWLDGYDVRDMPLVERKEILKQLVPDNSIIKYSDYIEEYGMQLFATVKQNGYEGIVAKRKLSSYWCGKRSKDWLKLPVVFLQKFVIAGWVESEVTGKALKTLLFGYYDKGKLLYYHHSGSGWKDKEMPDMVKALKTIEVPKSPFANDVDYEGVKHWIKPLVAEFKITKITKEGEIRHPAVWQGWCVDTKAKEVTKETVEWLKQK